MQGLINLDQKVFYWFNSFLERNDIFDFIVKVIAVYAIYLIPILFILFWFLQRREKTQKFLLELFFVLVVSWQVIARAIGMIINRPRPDMFTGAKEILFHPPTYSFPSDHALFLACVTVYLYLSGYKKIANYSLIAMITIPIARVIIGFHFPGDILAGWIMGGALAYIFFLFKKPIEKYIVNPLYRVAKKMRLA